MKAVEITIQLPLLNPESKVPEHVQRLASKIARLVIENGGLFQMEKVEFEDEWSDED